MSPGSIVRERSKELAVEVFLYVRELRSNAALYEICSQLVRSGTAPGAIVSEAREAESKKDLIHKLRIALKEARETEYWLDLLSKTGSSLNPRHGVVDSLNNEVISLLVVSLSTLSKR